MCHILFSWGLICLLAQRSQDFPLCSWISEPLQSRMHIYRYSDALVLVFLFYSWFLSLLNEPSEESHSGCSQQLLCTEEMKDNSVFISCLLPFGFQDTETPWQKVPRANLGLQNAQAPVQTCTLWELLLSCSTCLPNIYFDQTILKEKPHNRRLKKLQLCA